MFALIIIPSNGYLCQTATSKLCTFFRGTLTTPSIDSQWLLNPQIQTGMHISRQIWKFPFSSVDPCTLQPRITHLKKKFIESFHPFPLPIKMWRKSGFNVRTTAPGQFSLYSYVLKCVSAEFISSLLRTRTSIQSHFQSSGWSCGSFNEFFDKCESYLFSMRWEKDTLSISCKMDWNNEWIFLYPLERCSYFKSWKNERIKTVSDTADND